MHIRCIPSHGTLSKVKTYQSHGFVWKRFLHFPPVFSSRNPTVTMAEMEITRLDLPSGMGIGRVLSPNEGTLDTHPVKFTLPGERIIAKISKIQARGQNAAEKGESSPFTHSGDYIYLAELVKVLTPSANRVTPVCKLFGHCNGCQLQHMSYEAQLQMKYDYMKTQFSWALEKFPGLVIGEVVGSPKTYNYRSKISPHLQKRKMSKDDQETQFFNISGNNLWRLGFGHAFMSKYVVDAEQCAIASETINKGLMALRSFVGNNMDKYHTTTSFLLRDTSFGGNRRAVTGHHGRAREVVGQYSFDFITNDFFQVNASILPLLVRHVTHEASPLKSGVKFLVDTYCGVGLFAISGASKFSKVEGIESGRKMVAAAKSNMLLNKVQNCNFVEGDASEIFAKVTFPAAETAVIIDPPSKGCNTKFLDQLIAYGPHTIVYVSCNPTTQSRDVKYVTEKCNYKIVTIQPFDMFPQTINLENVVTLTKT